MNTRVITSKNTETENAGGVHSLCQNQSGFFVTVYDLTRPGIGFADKGRQSVHVAVGEDRGCSAHEESMNLPGPIANKKFRKWGVGQKLFKQQVAAWKKKYRMGSKDAAALLGTTIGTLNAYLYRASAMPSIGWLRRACKIMGCAVAPFIENDPQERRESRDRRMSPSRRKNVSGKS